MAIEAYGGPDSLKAMELPDPKVGPDVVLIRARAAAVNPVDAGIRAGNLDGAFPSFFPLVPGWDVAGVVEAAGPAVYGYAPGDEVMAYARKHFIQEGTYAEFVSVSHSSVAPKPSSLSFEEAAALPLAGLTAYQAVHDKLALEAGETLLVLGASGGVGSFAVQLGRIVGAEVIAVASERNHDYLRGLGAAECIDYSEGDVAEAVRAGHSGGVDAVLDTVRDDDLGRSPGLLSEGGRLVSIVVPPDAEEFERNGRRGMYEFVQPDGAELAALGELAQGGELRVELSETLPLADVARAHELIEGGHTRGKLALTIDQ